MMIPVNSTEKTRFNPSQELEDAESTKDKKFVKRKAVLKKIVANITMGNDSWYFLRCNRLLVALTSPLIVSPLFPEIIRCMTLQVLEIKKSAFKLTCLI